MLSRSGPRLFLVPLVLGSLLGACGGAGPASVAVPSGAPSLASATDQAEAADLLRQGQLLLSPPPGQQADPMRGAALVERAARLGEPEAQLLVAAGHLHGAPEDRDPAAAIPWLNRAAHAGQPVAQYRLGRLLEAGDGTPRDAAWAALWFQRAAERGQAEAHYALALMQIAGDGTARDEPEALARLAIAERAGVPGAARYRQALRPRVTPAAARRADARIAAERTQGAVQPDDRPMARFVQSSLAGLGSWTAPVDGRPGTATRRALAGFASAEGLSAEDPATIDRLRARVQSRSVVSATASPYFAMR